jgi:hypothetical protein
MPATPVRISLRLRAASTGITTVPTTPASRQLVRMTPTWPTETPAGSSSAWVHVVNAMNVPNGMNANTQGLRITGLPHAERNAARLLRVMSRACGPANGIGPRSANMSATAAILEARPRAGCGDFGPRGRIVRHGDSLSSCVVAGERADDGGFSWLPRMDSNHEPAG